MTNIAQTFASKALVAVVAAAMIFTLFAPAAKAQTTEELQKMINDLMAQIAALQGQGNTTSPASGICPFTWTRDLSMGSTGADVMKLQQFLNSNADTRVSASGAGSVGAETSYYGPATAAAVSKFQVMYRAEVLVGLVNPTGYFGPASRAKANALCVTAPVVPPVTSTSTPTTPDVTLQGEADLDSVELEDADDSSVEEGDEDVAIGVVNVEFTNGDAEITRMDLKLDGGTPWQAFETIALWVDGDEVASVDASSKSDYLSSTNGTLRFSGLDIVANEDEVLDITVVATIQSTVRNLSSNGTWTLAVDSLRFVDADGVVSTENAKVGGVVDTNQTADFTIEAEGTNDDAKIKKSSANPDASTLKVEDNSSNSDEYPVFAFNIDIDEDSADTELDMAYATITAANLGTSTFAKVVNNVKMTIDGKTVTGKVFAGDTSASTTIVYSFDFNGLALDADDVYEAVLALTFKGQNDGANYSNGVTITASVEGADWELESVKTGDYILTGSQSSKLHTLATVVPVISGVTSSVDRNEAGDAGTISFDFTVEADDDDVSFDLADIVRTITGGSAATTTTLTKVAGDATGGPTWTVSEGDDATFSLDITFTAASTTDNGAYRVTVDTIAGVKIDKTSAALNLTK